MNFRFDAQQVAKISRFVAMILKILGPADQQSGTLFVEIFVRTNFRAKISTEFLHFRR